MDEIKDLRRKEFFMKDLGVIEIKKLKVKPGVLPRWAKYVSKDKSGRVNIYDEKPSISIYSGMWVFDNFGTRYKAIDLKIKGPWEKSLRKIEVIKLINDGKAK